MECHAGPALEELESPEFGGIQLRHPEMLQMQAEPEGIHGMPVMPFGPGCPGIVEEEGDTPAPKPASTESTRSIMGCSPMT